MVLCRTLLLLGAGLLAEPVPTRVRELSRDAGSIAVGLPANRYIRYGTAWYF